MRTGRRLQRVRLRSRNMESCCFHHCARFFCTPGSRGRRGLLLRFFVAECRRDDSARLVSDSRTGGDETHQSEWALVLGDAGVHFLRCWCSFSSCRRAVFAPPTLWMTGNDPEMGFSCSRSAQIWPSHLLGTGLMVFEPTANENLVLWGQKRPVVCALFEGQKGVSPLCTRAVV